jgi:hypothetical protein
LNVAKITIPKTHDLEYLVQLVGPLEPLWMAMHRDLRDLSFSAVLIRYPGEWASRAAATKAFELCKKLRDLARRRLGLK